MALSLGSALVAPADVNAAGATKRVSCGQVNLRTGPWTAKRVRDVLDTGTRVWAEATVKAGYWQADCGGRLRTGNTWYRITSIDGRSVQSRYGVRALYAASGLLTQVSTAVTPDPYARELMRLINLDRRALGRSTLQADSFLVGLARSTKFACPDQKSMVITGRAADMARRSYFSHDIKGCKRPDGTTWRSRALMSVFGYNGRRSEIIHWNYYPRYSTTYRIGCDINGRNCKGGTTTTTNQVAIAQRSFMGSASHRYEELDLYQRFGCGTATVAGTTRTYFSCFFADGPPSR
jgi:hypothetical protein